ncbi:DUF2997 domain-containing protein [Clostridium botulinum]|uniref:DUF2997 domain-containing protein n=1 Tax=Clostridium botulinum (strain Okra / Type B1) TaxID=498213 RepID=B1IHY3_CLOBK|nr:DUF2997 domain-containing protein [Clostridium botulinum]EKX79478.1 hypothetical protein CFSAN001628_012538 [Clostridium botulinum CFSAN001628]ACA43680.1 hypothetical protein CLD_3566 [Clostridium botulinum B1 str. Okra]KEI91350.1 hypothetical protein N491_05375 [Clostridium botulinum B2 275]MBD5562545.1 DUF2997 domain-containing protein [Clostridium botulinum]MBD5565516.1 DUF2997 domain-containing protein [Clostridium botulinum]
MTKQIKLRIYPDGIVQAEVEGIKGKKCTNYISIIENLLEAKVADSEYTSEYYEEEVIESYAEENITLKEGR